MNLCIKNLNKKINTFIFLFIVSALLFSSLPSLAEATHDRQPSPACSPSDTYASCLAKIETHCSTVPNSAARTQVCGTGSQNARSHLAADPNYQLTGSEPTTGGGASTDTGSQSLVNPLQSTGTLPALIQAILNIFIIIVTPIIVFFIIYAGFLYVTGRGNPAKIQQAHKALIYALIGGVIIIGAGAITTIVQQTVSSF